jgi:hypothetical protein
MITKLINVNNTIFIIYNFLIKLSMKHIFLLSYQIQKSKLIFTFVNL